MVRQKNRFLIVNLDFDEQLMPASIERKHERDSKKRRRPAADPNNRILPAPADTDDGSPPLIEAKDIHRVLRAAMESNFGILGAGMVHTMRVLLYDETDRLAIIKVPREYCPMVRSALTFITSINDANTVISTVSVHGSARTVKMAALDLMRKNFHRAHDNKKQKRCGSDTTLTTAEEKALLRLEARMGNVREMD
jgi:RNase P/RNase MRP subunit POP5